MSPSARPVITGRTDSHDTAVVDLPLSIVEIPTLGEWGLIALMPLLALAALRRLRPAGI